MATKYYGAEILVSLLRNAGRIDARAKVGPKVGEPFLKYKLPPPKLG